MTLLFASSLVVPCDDLTADDIWSFPEHISNRPQCSLFISCSIDSCLFHSQSEVLGALSAHFMCKVLRKHLLMKVCTFYTGLHQSVAN